jgi:uncharacterized protein
MYRSIEGALANWKVKKGRMPLVLNGARQVGKTYSIKEFGRLHFEKVVYINLEVNIQVSSFFDGDLIPSKIIQYLEVVSETRINPSTTLIILDEIQSCPRALLSLKSFTEDAPEYFIIAAGSLLGVAINRVQFSYPVGKVEELNMHPMDFEEYLIAIGRLQLRDQIKQGYLENSPLPKALHNEAMGEFKNYLIIGGMPACLNEYVSSNSHYAIREIQGRILNEYVADMAKYATPSTSVKIRACFDSIPAQLAKENTKFQYKTVQRGGTATIFGEAIDWLNFAGLVYKCKKTSHGFIPISAYTDLSDFKLYMGDVGLLTAKSGIPVQTIMNEYESANYFLGMVCENYVAQALTTNGHPLYYWKNENTAELDFILPIGENNIPIEVKKGSRTKSTSFNLYMKQYDATYGIRISSKNFGLENGIKSVPLYAVWLL